MTNWELIQELVQHNPNAKVEFRAEFKICQGVKAEIARNGEIEIERVQAEVEIKEDLEVDEIVFDKGFFGESVVTIKLEY